MKKKIGILTQPLINNYGGILQAYALTTILNEMGYHAEIIDRKYEAYNDTKLKQAIKTFIKKYFLRRINPDILEIQQNISRNTLKFVKENIKLSNEVYFSSNIMNINSIGYDVIVVGSDQVWRPMYSPCITNYFLDFCQGGNIRKISYAASFGVSEWEYSEKETRKCAELIKSFDAISVREDSAIDLCEKYLHMCAELVLEPTLLLDKIKYENLVRKYDEPVSDGNLMYYVLDKDNNKEKIINYIAQEMKLTPFSVMPKKSLNEKYEAEKNDQFIYPSLTKWLKGFMDSQFIITDSFHGCVFSIIFNKPFIAIGNRDRGLARFSSLLQLFNLETRLIFNFDDLSNEHLNYKFDWNVINEVKEKNKKFSLSFLLNNINGENE